METTLCYIEQSDCYLMLLRNKKEQDPSAGKWIGVGGKVLPGETPEECVLREVEEETGFVLLDYQARGMVRFNSDSWESEDMYVFSAQNFAFAPMTPIHDGLPLPECNEGTLAWIPKDQIMDLSLWEGDRLFLQKLLDGKKDVSMTLTYEGDTLVSVEE